jgi:hypothetical protein
MIQELEQKLKLKEEESYQLRRKLEKVVSEHANR